jgi:hypothetical protein
VTVSGWYRRLPGPVVELRRIEGETGAARSWEWIARKAMAWVVVTAGVLVMLAGVSG